MFGVHADGVSRHADELAGLGLAEQGLDPESGYRRGYRVLWCGSHSDGECCADFRD
jgi:hypothetical protein